MLADYHIVSREMPDRRTATGVLDIRRSAKAPFLNGLEDMLAVLDAPVQARPSAIQKPALAMYFEVAASALSSGAPGAGKTPIWTLLTKALDPIWRGLGRKEPDT